MGTSWTAMLFSFFGGLGFFLFGIKSMSEGLQSIAGDKLRIFLEKGTKTPLRGVLTGALVTALIQSSSGTTVLTVGLVNAGLLPLRQAIGVIMGANIGTTITAYLIGFKLSDYALPAIALGVFLIFFFKNKRMHYLGQIIFGFGLLFYGMDIMGNGMKPLRNSAFFIDLMANVDNNALLGVLIGTVFTAIVQSSSATIGVLQELGYQGVITYNQAVPILLGDNIGTTITALLAGLGATVAAKRASTVHFIFNLLGTFIFLPLFLIGILPTLIVFFTDIIYFLLPGLEGSWETLNIRMQIAQTHGVFNIANTLIQLPFVGTLAYIVSKIIPSDEPETTELSTRIKYLEPRLLGNAPVALGNATKETLRMGNIASETLHLASEYFFTHKANKGQKARQFEDLVDQLEKEITDYVVQASAHRTLTDELSRRRYLILQVIGDLERVGDHSDNIVDATDLAIENKIFFSKKATEDLRNMIEQVKEIFGLSLQVIKTGDAEIAKEILAKDDLIDQMEIDLRKSHVDRLHEGVCNGNAGALYLDILSNLERIGDHSVNIAKYILEDI